jgi:hypothetical protein
MKIFNFVFMPNCSVEEKRESDNITSYNAIMPLVQHANKCPLICGPSVGSSAAQQERLCKLSRTHTLAPMSDPLDPKRGSGPGAGT